MHSSIGTYFSLVAYNEYELIQCLFLSPVVDMERVINNLTFAFDVSEERLMAEKEIYLPIGQILYWSYYCYVKFHQTDSWGKKTAVFYGLNDDLCEYAIIRAI